MKGDMFYEDCITKCRQGEASLTHFQKRKLDEGEWKHSSFNLRFPQIASSAEIALLLENGDGPPFHCQLLSRFGLTGGNAELHRLRS